MVTFVFKCVRRLIMFDDGQFGVGMKLLFL